MSYRIQAGNDMKRNDKIDGQTVQIIVAELRRVLKREVAEGIQFDQDTPLSEVHDQIQKTQAGEGCFDDFCWHDVLEPISEHFGMGWSEAKWEVWFKLNKKMEHELWRQEVLEKRTVGDVARLIESRVVIANFSPVTILGQTCAPAGAFFGIRDLVSKCRFAPSTRIRDLLKTSDIRTLWEKVSWMSGKELPSLQTRNPMSLIGLASWIEAGCIFISILLAIGCLWNVFSVGDGATASWLAMLVAALFSTVNCWMIARVLVENILDPLPDEITTFGDLARVIADAPARGKQNMCWNEC